MLLDLDGPTGPSIGEVRPIEEADLAELRAPKAKTPVRQKLRYKHHALARSLASGMQECVAGMICGFAPATVSILKGDPAFAELVRFYESEDGKGFDSVRAQLLGIGQRFIEEMERRIAEDPESVTMRDLRETATLLLDRSGYGPASQTQHDVHIHAGLADALKASRATAPFPALPERPQDIVDGEFVELSFQEVPLSQQEDRASSVTVSSDEASILAWDEE